MTSLSSSPLMPGMEHIYSSDLYPLNGVCPKEDSPFPLVDGEYITYLEHFERPLIVTLDDSQEDISCEHRVTAISNYRFFVRTPTAFVNVPLSVIDNVDYVDVSFLQINCKNGQTYRCCFTTSEQCLDLHSHLTCAINVSLDRLDRVFAFSHYAWTPNSLKQATVPFDKFDQEAILRREVIRMGFNTESVWRISKLNTNHQICNTYPSLHVVPMWIADSCIQISSTFRACNRFPAVVWRCTETGSVIARCSQPEVGLLGWRNEADEKLLQSFVDACQMNPGTKVQQSSQDGDNEKRLLIIDARSYTASVANRAKGGGCECSEYYSNCEIQYMGMANIHSIRKSFVAMRTLCISPAEHPSWLSALEQTKWLGHLSALLRSALVVSRAIQDGRPVVVHCSDGWDRTPQIIAITELLVDPYYRTTEGFIVLVEREWLSYGHKFADRCGTGVRCDDPNQRCPVFAQWLDCVHQLIKQFPTAFQFNEAFLVKLVQHTYSCLYGNFLCNSVCQRLQSRVYQHTGSVWQMLLQPDNPRYTNLLYQQKQPKVLRPCFLTRSLHIWSPVWLHESLSPLANLPSSSSAATTTASPSSSALPSSSSLASSSSSLASSSSIASTLVSSTNGGAGIKELSTDCYPARDDDLCEERLGGVSSGRGQPNGQLEQRDSSPSPPPPPTTTTTTATMPFSPAAPPPSSTTPPPTSCSCSHADATGSAEGTEVVQTGAAAAVSYNKANNCVKCNSHTITFDVRLTNGVSEDQSANLLLINDKTRSPSPSSPSSPTTPCHPSPRYRSSSPEQLDATPPPCSSQLLLARGQPNDHGNTCCPSGRGGGEAEVVAGQGEGIGNTSNTTTGVVCELRAVPSTPSLNGCHSDGGGGGDCGEGLEGVTSTTSGKRNHVDYTASATVATTATTATNTARIDDSSFHGSHVTPPMSSPVDIPVACRLLLHDSTDTLTDTLTDALASPVQGSPIISSTTTTTTYIADHHRQQHPTQLTGATSSRQGCVTSTDVGVSTLSTCTIATSTGDISDSRAIADASIISQLTNLIVNTGDNASSDASSCNTEQLYCTPTLPTSDQCSSNFKTSDFWVGEDLESSNELYDVDGLIVWQSAADKSLCDKERRNEAEKSALKRQVMYLKNILKHYGDGLINASNNVRIPISDESPCDSIERNDSPSTSDVSWEQVDEKDTEMRPTRLADQSASHCNDCHKKFCRILWRKLQCRRCGEVYCSECINTNKTSSTPIGAPTTTATSTTTSTTTSTAYTATYREDLRLCKRCMPCVDSGQGMPTSSSDDNDIN